MIATHWRKAGLLTLLVSASVLIPGAAQAEAPSLTVDVFGNTKPGDPDAGDPLKGTGVLFANSTPYGPGTYDEGLIYFKGVAKKTATCAASQTDADTCGVEIFVTVDESPDDPASPTITKRVTSRPEDGIFSGEIGNCNGCIHPQALGTHAATTTDSNDPDPLKWGGTSLRLGFTARNTQTFETSPVVEKLITKYAGTPGDNAAPAIPTAFFPPATWCHNAKAVRGDILIVGRGGSAALMDCEGRSPAAYQQVFGFPSHPLQGPACSNETRVTVGNVRASWCSGLSLGASSGTQCVCGFVNDATSGSYGIHSEIADVTVTITGGTLTAPRIYRPAVGRGGGQAGYGVNLNINDFEPNWQVAPPYTVTVTATDAWGKAVTRTSNFSVTPF